MNPTFNLNMYTFDLLRHLVRVANWKTQLVLCDLRHIGYALPVGKRSLTCDEVTALFHEENKPYMTTVQMGR
jgi:hypothetical protein